MSLSKSRRKVGLRKNKIDTLETRMLEVEKKIDLICEWIESKYGNVLPSTEDVPSGTLNTKALNLTRVLQPSVRVTKLPNSSVTLLSKPNSSPFNVCEFPKKGWTTLVTNSSHPPISNINKLPAQDIPYYVLPVDPVTELPQIMYVDNTYAEPQRLNYDSSSNDLCISTQPQRLNYDSSSNDLCISTPGRLCENRKQTLEPRNIDNDNECEIFEVEEEIKIELDYPSLSSPNHTQNQEYILPSVQKNGKKRSTFPKCKTLPPSKSNVLSKRLIKSNIPKKGQSKSINFIVETIQLTPNNSKGNRGISKRSPLLKLPKSVSTSRERKRLLAECEICGKTVTKGNLKAHIDTHSAEGKYNCETCGKSFKLVQSWKLHKAMHLGIKTQCSVCGIQITRNHLTRHMRYIHEKVRPYPCAECSLAFKNAYALRCHLKSHQNPKSKKRGLNKDRENFSRKLPLKKINEIPKHETETATILVSNLTLESIPGVQPEPKDNVSICVPQYQSKDTPTYEISLTPSENDTTFSSQPDWYNPIMPDNHIVDTHHPE